MHRSCALATSALLIIASSARAQRAQPVDTAALQRILIAEDSRATDAALQPVLDASTGADTLLRRVAIRAIGRLQRPAMLPQLITALHDNLPSVRAEAATAITQSLINIRRSPADPRQDNVRTAADALIAALGTETSTNTAGAIAEALGRLPYGDSTGANRAAEALIAHQSHTFDGVRGFYWLALYRRNNPLPPALVPALHADWLRTNAAARRVATLTLGLINALDSATSISAGHDPDPQVRRLALAGLARLSPALRETLLQRALADTSAIVRIGAIAAFRAGNPTPDCTPLIAASSDRNDYVALAAIDALGGACSDASMAQAALQVAISSATSSRTHRSIPAEAHAIVALARQHVAPPTSALQSTQWLIRVAAANAAAVVSDTTVLYRLARDPDHNVREAAITGLAAVVKHGADSTYIAALTSPGYQVALAASTALAKSPDTLAVPALFNALDRLTAEHRENSRDPRMGILKALPATASSGDADRLRPYLADFDTAVAATAATDSLALDWHHRHRARDPATDSAAAARRGLSRSQRDASRNNGRRRRLRGAPLHRRRARHRRAHPGIGPRALLRRAHLPARGTGFCGAGRRRRRDGILRRRGLHAR